MSRRRARLLAAALVAALGAGGALAAPLPAPLPERPLRFEVPRPRRAALANGIVVLLLEERSLPTVSAGVLVRAGSADDPPGLGGLADVTVETMRSGGAGERGPAAFEMALASLAATLECEAEVDSTRCVMWSPAAGAPQALEQLADLLRRPRFDSSALRTARERRAEAARREDDDPEEVAEREFTRRLFAGQPYGNWPDARSVEGIRAGDVRDFHARHFRPSRLLLYAAGDFDAESMLRALGGVFGDWQEPAGEKPQAAGGAAAAPGTSAAAGGAGAAPGAETGLRVVARPLEQTHLMLGHRGPRWDDPDLPAIEVLNQLLTYYRYYVDLRDTRGLAYTAYAAFSTRRLGGALTAYAGTRAESARETLGVMRRHLEEVAAGRFTEAEFRGARDAVAASFVHRFATAADTVEEFARAELRGRSPEWLAGYGQAVAGLTRGDLKKVAGRLLHPSELLMVVVGDPARFGDLEAP